MAEFDSLHSDRICKHYIHAREKHPYFCDEVIPGKGYKPEDRKIVAASCLYVERQRIKVGARDGNILWKELLDCEVWEAIEALVNGDTAHAIDECYDAISVLLRTIDVLEGRQKLGRNIPNEHKND